MLLKIEGQLTLLSHVTKKKSVEQLGLTTVVKVKLNQLSLVAR